MAIINSKFEQGKRNSLIIDSIIESRNQFS